MVTIFRPIFSLSSLIPNCYDNLAMAVWVTDCFYCFNNALAGFSRYFQFLPGSLPFIGSHQQLSSSQSGPINVSLTLVQETEDWKKTASVTTAEPVLIKRLLLHNIKFPQQMRKRATSNVSWEPFPLTNNVNPQTVLSNRPVDLPKDATYPTIKSTRCT